MRLPPSPHLSCMGVEVSVGFFPERGFPCTGRPMRHAEVAIRSVASPFQCLFVTRA